MADAQHLAAGFTEPHHDLVGQKQNWIDIDDMDRQGTKKSLVKENIEKHMETTVGNKR